MTRKTVTCSKDGEGKDYMKLKELVERESPSGRGLFVRGCSISRQRGVP